jgi:perosamine synthetase
MKNKMFIPVYKPFLNGNEKLYVQECLDSSWISSKGKFVSEFEKSFSKFIDVQYSLSVCNGTVALHLALVALGIKPGDEVIVPTLTYVATVNAISYVGATPVFVDSEEKFWQMDVNEVKKKITKKTKCILLVHLYGHPCNMDEIMDLAERHKLYVVEDCAEAFGSYYKDRHVGIFGDIATFSFYGNKTITTGEGGMVITKNKNLYESMKILRDQGDFGKKDYWHDVIGYNYRMTNICAALGLAQLEQAKKILRKKRQLVNWYKKHLNDIPIIYQQTAVYAINSYWMFSICVLNMEEQRDALRIYLKYKKIETRPLFPPVHLFPMYSCYGEEQQFIGALKLSQTGLNLPSYPSLIEDEVKYICDQIKIFFDEQNIFKSKEKYL